MAHPWVMVNNCVKYYPDPTWQWGVMARTRIFGMCVLRPWPWRYNLESMSWHTLGSWTAIVWNIIEIGQGGKKLWPGHDVNRRTDRRTDRKGDSYIPPSPANFVCWGIINDMTSNNISICTVSYTMVPTDHDIPFSRTFQGLLRYIFKDFSRTFLCSFKHPFVKKWSTMYFSNKTYRDHLILSSPEKWWGEIWVCVF